MIKVLLVDDDQLIRESLKILLNLQEDLEVLGVCRNGQEALEFLTKEGADVVLMDIRMPVMDGVQTTKEVKNRFPGVKIILLTTFKEDEYIKEALKHGAEGYILKSQSSDSIIETIRAVHRGNAVYQQEVMASLTDLFKEKRRSGMTEIPVDLTDRELEVLKGIGEGKSNKEIAKALFLGEGTVRNYVTKMLDKLSLRDRTQLAIFYHENIKEE